MDITNLSHDSLEKSFMQPSIGKFAEGQIQINKEEILSSKLVSNSCVDRKGRTADKRYTGGWKATQFIIVNEVAERLAFYAIAVNMVAYLVGEMRQSLPNAATHVANWIGAAYALAILGAFVAHAYLGRFNAIILFSSFYAVGMASLTLSASVDCLRPPPCKTGEICAKATDGQNAFLIGALGLIALGTGGIKSCVSSFGADQFDEADEKEAPKKYAFFNWFFFAINMGALFGTTVMVYVKEEKGWGWGFGVPTLAMIFSVFIYVAGSPYYRFLRPMGNPFARFLQVVVASVRNHLKGVKVRSDVQLYEVKTKESDIKGARKLPRTTQFTFLDKAAVVTDPEIDTTNRWKLCTVTQVEEFKCLIRILPIWASTIAFSISFAQVATFFTSQTLIMNRKLNSNFIIPAGSVTVFSAINALILVPIYEKYMVPILKKLTGHRRGITSLQRIGVGLFFSIFALASAALVEKKRRDSFSPSDMSVFWLFPQYFLIGTAEVFAYVGQLEFFWDEASDGTRSISGAFFLSQIGIGSWLSSAIVKIIEKTTGGEEKGWLRNNLNESRLDYFYWILTGINGLNFVAYLWISWRYRGRNSARRVGVIE